MTDLYDDDGLDEILDSLPKKQRLKVANLLNRQDGPPEPVKDRTKKGVTNNTGTIRQRRSLPPLPVLPAPVWNEELEAQKMLAEVEGTDYDS